MKRSRKEKTRKETVSLRVFYTKANI